MKHAEVESPPMLPGDSPVALESILCTEELNRRPSRAPDYQADKCALVELAQALADSPRTILQTMAEKMLEIFHCDSAGFSLLKKDRKNFYWPAIAGMWQPHIGGGTPRNFGPCGDVLDCNRPLLFSHWERRYPYLLEAMPVAEEGLLVPFYVEGKAVGTIWVIAHNDRRKFDAEDMRQLVSLGSFASSAYQVVAFLDALEQRDDALRQSCEELEQRVVKRTSQLTAINEELRNEILERQRAEKERQWTDQELRESEGRYRYIFQAAGVSIWEEDFSKVKAAIDDLRARGLVDFRKYLAENPEFVARVIKMVRIVDVNEATVTLFGAESKEQLLFSLEKIFTPETEKTFAEELIAIAEGRTYFESETIVQTIKGDKLTVLLAITFPAEPAKFDSVLVSIMDITDRKRAEEAVRRSEKELRDLIGTIPAMAFVTRGDGSNKFVSRQWIEFSGLSGEQSRGSGWAATLHPEDREQHLAKWQAAQASGQPFEGEARYRDAHGNYRWLLVRAVPLRNEQGKILKWYGTAIDIEARKRAEEALRASEQLARSHVEVMMRSLDVLATEAAPEKFIAELLRTIGQHLHASAVLLWLRNQDDDSVRLHLMIEGDQQVAPDPEHPYLKDPRAWKRSLEEMLFTKGPMVCDNIEQDLRIGTELREYMMNRGRKKFLAIPMFVLGEVRGFISIHHVEGRAYRSAEIELAQALAHHVMIATHEAELGEQRRRAVILKERTRMARDIHDTLAQGFTGIILQLEAVANAISGRKPKKVKKCLQRASDLARRGLNEARRSVHALRPEALEHVNFWEALKGLIKNTAAATPIRTKSWLRGKLPQLPLDWQEDLMHIGQEALTNALKYAHADTFETRLVCHAKNLRLEFQDDGDGFDVNDQHDGVGLTGICERVAQMGGELKITSARGKGTKVTVVLPYNGESMS